MGNPWKAKLMARFNEGGAVVPLWGHCKLAWQTVELRSCPAPGREVDPLSRAPLMGHLGDGNAGQLIGSRNRVRLVSVAPRTDLRDGESSWS